LSGVPSISFRTVADSSSRAFSFSCAHIGNQQQADKIRVAFIFIAISPQSFTIDQGVAIALKLANCGAALLMRWSPR
jgi:hypothetical protein